jgi:hypothetical protein
MHTKTRDAIIALAAAILFSIAAIGIFAYAQVREAEESAVTTRDTAACLNLEDLQKARTLASPDNLLAAIAAMTYLLEHGCTLLKERTYVSVLKKESDYVCIRQRGAKICLWTLADSIMKTVNAD